MRNIESKRGYNSRSWEFEDYGTANGFANFWDGELSFDGNMYIVVL